MIIPEYWAEARAQRPRSKKESAVTVRRFGWSETSQAEAEQMAKERADAALKQILGGESVLRRRELKTPYNGADGVPIREEVLARHDDTVITRNSYGAHCLNTPDVLFADVDYNVEPQTDWGCGLALLVLISAGVSIGQRNATVFFATLAGVLLLSHVLKIAGRRTRQRRRDQAAKNARRRIDDFVAAHRDWHLRLYQTPAGLRLLVLHRTFKPDEPAVKEFFDVLGVDEIYAQMCFNQQCFRARVSPKPWRMGFAAHIRPRPGTWPVKSEHLEVRNGWIREYETKAKNFASCQYLESFGPKTVDPKAARVLAVHDAMSQALSGKPIA